MLFYPIHVLFLKSMFFLALLDEKKKEHTSPHNHVMQPLQAGWPKEENQKKSSKKSGICVLRKKNQNSQTINQAVRPWERKQLCVIAFM